MLAHKPKRVWRGEESQDHRGQVKESVVETGQSDDNAKKQNKTKKSP